MPSRASGASSTTSRAAARRCSSSRSSRSSWATPGARRSSRSRRRRSASSTSSRRSWRAQRRQLRETLDALARFDLWAAKARLAEEMDAIRAETSDGRESCCCRRATRVSPGGRAHRRPARRRLHGARHHRPQHGRQDGRAAHRRACCALMHQSGLHVPAATGSRLPVFRDVFADIGDEQSVAQSLSTFSGHLRSIVRIVEAAGPGCLVLLDELGAGTDPTEGSALAQALLDHFIRAGALVVATTHYAELKIYAHDTPRGAQRLGRVRPRDAQPDLPPDHRPAGHEPGVRHRRAPGPATRRSSRTPAVAAVARPAGVRVDARVDQGLPGRRSRRHGETARAPRRARARPGASRRRSAAAPAPSGSRRPPRRARGGRARGRGHPRRDRRGARLLARQTLTEARLDEAMARLEERLAAIPRPVRPRAGRGASPGALARRAARRHARRLAGHHHGHRRERGRATLEVGGVRVDVPLDDAASPPATAPARRRRAAPRSARDAPRPAPGRVRRPAPARPPRTPGVARRPAGGRGRAARSCRRASTCGAPAWTRRSSCWSSTSTGPRWPDAGRVTIVHGHGSGALRDAVRAVLAGHPLVREWRPGDRGEGGDGATIVSL